MIRRTYIIKDGMMYVSYPIEDYSSLLRYDWNLTCLSNDIRRSHKDEDFDNFLLKAKGLLQRKWRRPNPERILLLEIIPSFIICMDM